VYQRRNCFACHSGSRRLGPELTGIAQRFSRDDLFTAIIDPSKDISPAFVSTMIATTTGKVYNGMVVYESKQLYLLQTTPDTTVRISGEEVQSVQPSAISFMPTGLLDDAKDGDLADLYAYMSSLRKK
jgi:putative heme-binding domain-containing protein